MTPPTAYQAGRAAYEPATPAHCPFGPKHLAQAWAAGWNDAETAAHFAQMDKDAASADQHHRHQMNAEIWTLWNDDPT